MSGLTLEYEPTYGYEEEYAGYFGLTLEYEPTYGYEEYAGYLTTNSHLFCHHHRIIRQPLAKKI
nr:5514_t:CDS:2 [Entrophospora candida]